MKQICKVQDCVQTKHSKGLCSSHYMKMRRYGNTVGKGRVYVQHGLYNHPLYDTWQNIKARCYNKKSPHYKHYGGRGIKMCDRWFEDFANFLEDMGDKPTSKHSIDRINNDGGYTPDNCRWVTQDKQLYNQGLRKNNTSGYKGVAKARRGYWRAYIFVKGKQVSLGQYKTVALAIKAREKAEKIYV